MKKHGSIFVASLAFSLLLYQQQIGLNFVLFTVVSIVLTYFLKRKKWETTTWVAALIYFLSAIPVFLYANALAVICNMGGLFFFIGRISERRSSLFVQLLNGLYTSLTSFFNAQFDYYAKRQSSTESPQIDLGYWFKIIGIPIFFIAIFVVLYQTASPGFNALIQRINLSFLNYQWIIFTFFGYMLLYNCSQPIALAPLTQVDLVTGNSLFKNELKLQNNLKLAQENQLGIVLIGMLNLLLMVLIITSLQGYGSSSTHSAYDLSQSVHQGVYSIITSIILAIGIIIYFYRGNLNFYEKNKLLKGFTVLWIFLNAMLILITAVKNFDYFSIHGLTYKRIGVFIYLFLALCGLITTYLKVTRKQNLWFLARVNFSIVFILLIISSYVPWDYAITHYNMYKAEHTDIHYLLDLSTQNSDLLMANKTKFSPQAQVEIKLKFTGYHKSLAQKNWQELTFRNFYHLPPKG